MGNKKWKSANDRIGRCFGYSCRPKPTLIVVQCHPDLPRKIGGYDKCGVLHFGGIQRLACRAISASAELLVITVKML